MRAIVIGIDLKLIDLIHISDKFVLPESFYVPDINNPNEPFFSYPDLNKIESESFVFMDALVEKLIESSLLEDLSLLPYFTWLGDLWDLDHVYISEVEQKYGLEDAAAYLASFDFQLSSLHEDLFERINIVSPSPSNIAFISYFPRVSDPIVELIGLNRLRDILRSKIDEVFGMGSEIAVLNLIPLIAPDYNDKEIVAYFSKALSMDDNFKVSVAARVKNTPINNPITRYLLDSE